MRKTLCLAFCTGLLVAAGCDLGTYEKRSKEKKAKLLHAPMQTLVLKQESSNQSS